MELNKVVIKGIQSVLKSDVKRGILKEVPSTEKISEVVKDELSKMEQYLMALTWINLVSRISVYFMIEQNL
jgi:hypothetical protein